MGRSSSARWARACLILFTVFGLVAGMTSIALADDPPTDDATTTEVTDPPPTVDTTTPTTVDTPPPADPCADDPTAEGCQPAEDPPAESLGAQSEEVSAQFRWPPPLECGTARVDVSKAGGAADGVEFTAEVDGAQSPDEQTIVGGGSPASFSVDIPDFFGLFCLPKIVTVSEEHLDGWHQTGVTCDEGFEILGAYVITLGTDDVATCTFTNEPNTITVEKIVPEGAPPGEFPIVLDQFQCEDSWPPECGFDQIDEADFTGNGNATFGPLSLDATIPHLGIFRVRENVPDGWTLTDVTCSGGLLVHPSDDGYYIKLSDLHDDWAEASCEFTNEPNTSGVQITKVIGQDGTIPDGPWTFTGDVDDPGNESTRFDAAGFPSTLAQDTGGGGSVLFPLTTVSADGSSVTFTETPEAGFALSEVVCDKDPVPVTDNSFTLTVTPEEKHACTVRNLPAAIELTKTADPDSGLVAGDQLTYTIEATNTGEATLDNVVVTDPLPTSLSFVSSSDCTAVGQDVTCDLGDGMAAGETRTAELLVEVNAGVVGTIGNTATVTADPLGIAEAVSAVASADVTVAAVAGEVVVAPPPPGSASAEVTGTLPFTGGGGSSTPLVIAAVALLAGLGLALLGRQRRRSSLGA